MLSLFSLPAEIFEELCETGYVLLGGTFDSGLRRRCLLNGLLRLSILRLCVLLLGLSILLLRELLLRLSILGLHILLLRLCSLLYILRLCRLLNGLLNLTPYRLSLLTAIIRFGNRKARAAVCGLCIVGAIGFRLVVVPLCTVKTGEAGSYNSYLHLVLHIRVYPCAEYYVCRGVYYALDKLGRIVDLVESEVFAADNVENDAARTLYCSFKQRAVYSYAHCFDYSVFTLGNAYAEMCHTLILKYGLNVGKVEVYKCGVNYKFGNALYALL